jgi:hypothetical protein
MVGNKTVSLVPILLSALVACSTPVHGPFGGSTAASQAQTSEQCSTIGVMACRAMALVSRDSVSTCSAHRGRDGSRVEICGYLPAAAEPARPAPADQNVYPVRLAWRDNSDNESHFVIERCDQVKLEGEKKSASCTGVWRTIATVGANITNYTDKTAAMGKSYIYRVKATNTGGSSGYAQEAAITTPSR